MLANSTQYHPPFIGCVLDIAQRYPKKINLTPDNIHTACTTSLQQPLGKEGFGLIPLLVISDTY